MLLEPRPKKMRSFITAAIPQELKDRLQAYADQHNTTRSEALRFIVASFFAGDLNKIQETPTGSREKLSEDQEVR